MAVTSLGCSGPNAYVEELRAEVEMAALRYRANPSRRPTLQVAPAGATTAAPSAVFALPLVSPARSRRVHALLLEPLRRTSTCPRLDKLGTAHFWSAHCPNGSTRAPRNAMQRRKSTSALGAMSQSSVKALEPMPRPAARYRLFYPRAITIRKKREQHIQVYERRQIGLITTLCRVGAMLAALRFHGMKRIWTRPER